MQRKKPSYNQRKAIEKAKLDTYTWFVQKEYVDRLEIVNIKTNEVRVIPYK